MSKRKLTVKTLVEKCNALRNIEQGLSNKEEVARYDGVPTNTTSTWVKNKEKIYESIRKRFKQKNEN